MGTFWAAPGRPGGPNRYHPVPFVPVRAGDRGAHYDAEADEFVFTGIGEPWDEPERFAAVVIGGGKFYAIGAFAWVWMEAGLADARDLTPEQVAALPEFQQKLLASKGGIGPSPKRPEE